MQIVLCMFFYFFILWGLGIIISLALELLEQKELFGFELHFWTKNSCRLIYLLLFNICMWLYYWASFEEKSLVLTTDVTSSFHFFKYAFHLMISSFATGAGVETLKPMSSDMRAIFGIHQFINYAIPFSVAASIVHLYSANFNIIINTVSSIDNKLDRNPPPNGENGGSGNLPPEGNDNLADQIFNEIADIVTSFSSVNGSRNKIELIGNREDPMALRKINLKLKQINKTNKNDVLENLIAYINLLERGIPSGDIVDINFRDEVLFLIHRSIEKVEEKNALSSEEKNKSELKLILELLKLYLENLKKNNVFRGDFA